MNSSLNIASVQSLVNTTKSSSLQSAFKKAMVEEENPEAHNNSLKKVAQDFEALFIKQIFQESRGNGDEDGLFEKSVMRDFNTDLYDSKMAEHIAKSGGIGLADVIYNKYKK